MKFQLIGVNHRTAPLEVRERLAIPDSRLAEATLRLASHPGVEEAMVLSTCNRVELLARVTNGRADLRSFLGEYCGVDASAYASYLYECEDREAVRHIFRVAASLDSMIVGEPQILGQVKESYAVARAVGAVHSQLDALLTRAFTGRLARGIRNRLSEDLARYAGDFAPYPVQVWLTGSFKSAAIAQGRGDFISLWAGQIAPLLRQRHAEELFNDLVRETGETLLRVIER